jgi:hypothetical protein
MFSNCHRPHLRLEPHWKYRLERAARAERVSAWRLGPVKLGLQVQFPELSVLVLVYERECLKRVAACARTQLKMESDLARLVSERSLAEPELMPPAVET